MITSLQSGFIVDSEAQHQAGRACADPWVGRPPGLDGADDAQHETRNLEGVGETEADSGSDRPVSRMCRICRRVAVLLGEIDADHACDRGCLGEPELGHDPAALDYAAGREVLPTSRQLAGDVLVGTHGIPASGTRHAARRVKPRDIER